MSRLKVDGKKRRKITTDLIRFLVGVSSETTLLYADYEGDDEAIFYVASFFAINFENFQVRIGGVGMKKQRKLQSLGDMDIFSQIQSQLFTVY